MLWVLLFLQHFIMAVLKYGDRVKALGRLPPRTVSPFVWLLLSLRLLSPQIIKQLGVVSHFL